MQTGGEGDWVRGRDYFQQTMLQCSKVLIKKYLNDLFNKCHASSRRLKDRSLIVRYKAAAKCFLTSSKKEHLIEHLLK